MKSFLLLITVSLGRLVRAAAQTHDATRLTTLLAPTQTLLPGRATPPASEKPDYLAGPPDAKYQHAEIFTSFVPIVMSGLAYNNTAISSRENITYYIDADGDAIIYGDVRLGTEAELRAVIVGSKPQRRSLSLKPNDSRRWPGGRVYYKWDAGLSQAHKDFFLRGAKTWTDRLPFLRFINDPTNPTARLIKASSDNWSSSNVGCCGGTLKLADPSAVSERVAVHEIGHTLGLMHEHVRPDRDLYVTVDCNQIAGGGCSSAKAFNWAKVNPNAWSWAGSYDVDSVMHYYPQSGRSGAIDVISPKPGIVLKRSGLLLPTHTDVHRVCELYWEDCHSICGDGLFSPGYGEDCDDGNNVDGDGCSSSCKKDTVSSSSCVGTCNPSPIANICGFRATCTKFDAFGSPPRNGETFCMCQAGYRGSGLSLNGVDQYRVSWSNAAGSQTHRVFVRPGQDCGQLCLGNNCGEVPLKDTCS